MAGKLTKAVRSVARKTAGRPTVVPTRARGTSTGSSCPKATRAKRGYHGVSLASETKSSGG